MTFDSERSAGLTTSNYSGRIRASDIDLEDAKVNTIAPNRVGAVAQPPDTPSSNYTTPQVQRSSRVEDQRSETRPRLQLLDPSAADRFKNKTTVRETSGVPSGISNERSDSRRFQEQLVNPGESDIVESRTRNNSDTLILKEVARSVIDHADILQDFVAVSNSGGNSYRVPDEQANAVGKDVRTALQIRTEEKLVGNVPSSELRHW